MPEAATRKYPTDAEWHMIMSTAAHVWKSGMANDYGIKSESGVILVMLKGWELGLPLIGSLEHVRLIHGRVFVSAEAQQAIVLTRVEGARFRWVADGRDGVATVIAVRPGHQDITMTYTMDDAQQGGVLGKNPTYKSWPAALLRAGAMRNACKMQFADVILGLTGFDGEVDNDDDPERSATPPQALPASPAKPAPSFAAPKAAPAALPAPSRVVDAPPVQAAPPAEAPAPAPAQQKTEPAPAKAPAPAREPGDDGDEDAPPDYPLPFNEGSYAGKSLSDLGDEREFLRLISGFRNAAATAQQKGDQERATDRLGWADLVMQWARYRGFNLA